MFATRDEEDFTGGVGVGTGSGGLEYGAAASEDAIEDNEVRSCVKS
jgi:hypothetical protein